MTATFSSFHYILPFLDDALLLNFCPVKVFKTALFLSIVQIKLTCNFTNFHLP